MTRYLTLILAASSSCARYILRIAILIIISGVWEGMIAAGRQPADIDRLTAEWSRLPSDSLLSMGELYATYPMSPDSAMLCYSIVEAKEKSRLGNSGSPALIVSMLGKARISLYARQNYRDAYETLMRALELCENNASLKKLEAKVITRLASVCHILFEITKDREMYEEAFMLHTRGMKLAYEHGNFLDYDLSYLNLMSLSYVENDLRCVADDAAKYYASHADYKGDCTREYNNLLLQGLLSLERNDSRGSETFFRRQLDLLPDNGKYARYRYLTLICLSIAYQKGDDLTRAIDMAEKARELCVRFGLTDGELDAVRTLERLWSESGDSTKTAYWRDRMLNLKDSILTYSHSSGISKIKFNYDLRKATEQLQQSERERRLLIMWIAVASVIIIIVGVMLRIIIVSNIRLKKANKKIFEDYQAKLSRQNNSRASGVTVQACSDDKEIDSLYNEICQAVGNTDRVFQPDFTLNALAMIMDMSPTKISQVINRHDNVNFPTFINRLRVMEACRKFQNRDEFGNLTIETISHSVGFKSRAAFITAFKKETGLTPSEYLQQIKNA